MLLGMAEGCTRVGEHMRAVILAAGPGTRLEGANGEPKVLHDLLGLTFLDRVVLTARAAGIRSFIIVTGHHGRRVEAYVGDGSRWGVRARCVRNPRWPEGNGTSVLAAEDCVAGEPFLVLMGDHVMDPSILTGMLACGLEPPFVAVDPRSDAVTDLEEATKVRLQDGRVTEVSKKLKEWDAVDCGALLMDDEAFRVLKGLDPRREVTLNRAVNIMAREGSLRAWEIPNTWWYDLDTPAAVKAAEDGLLRDLAKAEDGPVARHLNRPLSRRISRRAVRWPLTPNHWSLLSFSFGILAAGLMAWGLPAGLVVGGLLAQLASVLDGVDGEVARLRYVASPAGGWFDAVLDRYADAAMLLGLAVGGWWLTGDLLLWPILVLALAGSMMVSYTVARYEASGLGRPRAGGLPAKRDSRALLIMLGGVSAAFVVQAPLVFLTLIGLLSNAEAIRRLVVWRKGRVMPQEEGGLTD
jgi:CDP-L-myo-inositol myo-inositolphosphotransferase